ADDDRGSLAVDEAVSRLNDELLPGPWSIHVQIIAPTDACGLEDAPRLHAIAEGTWADEIPICEPWFLEPERILDRWWPACLTRFPIDRTGDGVVDEADLEVKRNGVVLPAVEGDIRHWSYAPGSSRMTFHSANP